MHDEKDTCLQSAASTGNKNKHIKENKYAFENVEDEILHENKLFLRNKKIASTYNTTNTSNFKPFTKENPTKVIGVVLY